MKAVQKQQGFCERVRVEQRISQEFNDRWGWLVDEYRKTREEIAALDTSQHVEAPLPKANLKPFPATTTGMIGWLSSRPDCKLETYGPDIVKAKPLPDIYVVTRLTDPLSDGLEYCK